MKKLRTERLSNCQKSHSWYMAGLGFKPGESDSRVSMLYQYAMKRQYAHSQTDA
jgi:hypothetical protein